MVFKAYSGVAYGQRSLFAGLMLQDAVIHLPVATYQLGLTRFWQRVAVGAGMHDVQLDHRFTDFGVKYSHFL